MQSAPNIDYVAHCEKYCFFCVEPSVIASLHAVGTWEAFLKCALSEKGPYENKRLKQKLPKILRHAIKLTMLYYDRS